jgi:nucleoside-diphosphate kinase
MGGRMNRTLILIKPDGVERGLVGEVIRRFENKGFAIEALEMTRPDTGIIEEHYAEHRGKDHYQSVVDAMMQGPVVAMVVSLPDNAVAHAWVTARTIVGSTYGVGPGTIRGDYVSVMPYTVVHASDGFESAKREIALWFPALTEQ